MKKDIDILQCPRCGHCHFDMVVMREAPTVALADEVRDGALTCRGCGQKYQISGGIVHLLYSPSADILAQQEVTRFADEQSEHEGGGFAVTAENIERYRNQFLSIPEGDGSQLYTHGAFANLAGIASQYYAFVDRLGINGKETVLEIGADSCWSIAKFAQKGCECVGLDINHHLIAADLFMREHGTYFERVLGDMNRLPFRDRTFDLVFCSQVLHHSTDLGQTLREIARVLKPGGRLALFGEPMYGSVFAWRRLFFGAGARRIGVNERIYSLRHWLRAMAAEGLSPGLYFSLHPRYSRFGRFLALFRNPLVERLLVESRLYPYLVLEPYQANAIARKLGRVELNPRFLPSR